MINFSCCNLQHFPLLILQAASARMFADISRFRALVQLSSWVCARHHRHMEHQEHHDLRYPSFLYTWANWFWLITKQYLCDCRRFHINQLYTIRGWTIFTLMTCTSAVMNDLTMEPDMAWYCYLISNCRDLCLIALRNWCKVLLGSQGRGRPRVWDK